MNLNDFLDTVRPGLEPDIPQARQRALREGDSPLDYDEEIWCEWHHDEIQRYPHNRSGSGSVVKNGRSVS